MDLLINFAYLDPGTGSLIIQSLIGAVAGVAVFGRRILVGLKMKFGKGSKDSASSASADTSKSNNPDDTVK